MIGHRQCVWVRKQKYRWGSSVCCCISDRTGVDAPTRSGCCTCICVHKLWLRLHQPDINTSPAPPVLPSSDRPSGWVISSWVSDSTAGCQILPADSDRVPCSLPLLHQQPLHQQEHRAVFGGDSTTHHQQQEGGQGQALVAFCGSLATNQVGTTLMVACVVLCGGRGLSSTAMAL